MKRKDLYAGLLNGCCLLDRSIDKGAYRVLRPEAKYLLVCFSDRNGPARNHLKEEKIVELFHDHFRILWVRRASSLEADIVTRYLYQVLMTKA